MYAARISNRIPGAIVALVLGTVAVVALQTAGRDHRHAASAEFRAACRTSQIPRFRPDLIHGLLGPAFTVAMLGAIESLMSAVVSDRMTRATGTIPTSNWWRRAVANIVSPMFGGLPATGAIARTATNIRAGRKTPVAGMIHALTLLAILLFAAPLVSFVPLAVLAGILMVVSYNMGEWREIPSLLKLTKTDISVWLVTFALTVFADLTVAVEAGMILAALLFISRVAATTTVSQVTDDYVEDGRVHILQDKDIPYYATIFRIHGPFLFGATDKIDVVTENIHELPPVVILRLRNMTALDATGLFALEEVARTLKASGRELILCGAREQPLQLDSADRIRGARRLREHLRERAGSAASRRGSVRKIATGGSGVRTLSGLLATGRRDSSQSSVACLWVEFPQPLICGRVRFARVSKTARSNARDFETPSPLASISGPLILPLTCDRLRSQICLRDFAVALGDPS